MEKRRSVIRLELRVVQRGREAAAADLAADHDPLPLAKATIDEAAPEPCCLHFAGLIRR